MSDKKKLLVVIDPGHTGNTYNAGAVKGYYESKAVYDLSLYEKAALEKRGIDVILTRERNQDPGLYERGQMAVKKGHGYANVVFESNHSNAFNGKAYGVTIIRSAHLPSSEKLANRMIDAIVKVMKPSTGITYNRGVTTKTQSNGADWYGVIRGAVSGATTQGQAKNTDSPVQNKKTPYLVRIRTDTLNIRKLPTVHSAAVGFTGKGTFTITEEATGVVNASGDKSRWGRLRSGKGWICLDYAEKVA